MAEFKEEQMQTDGGKDKNPFSSWLMAEYKKQQIQTDGRCWKR